MCAAQQRRRDQLIRFFTRKALLLLRRSFREWARAAERYRMLTNMSEAIAARKARRKLAEAFTAWREIVLYFKKLRRSLDSAAAAAQLRLRKVAFSTWRLQTASARAIAALVLRKYTEACAALLQDAMDAWRAEAKGPRHEELRLARALRLLQGRRAAQAFAAWRAAAAATRELLEAQRNAELPLLARCFYGWLYLVRAGANKPPPPKPPPAKAPLPEAKTSQTPPEESSKYKVVPVTTKLVTSPPRYRQRPDQEHSTPLSGASQRPPYTSLSFTPSPMRQEAARTSASVRPEPAWTSPPVFGGASASTARSSAGGKMVQSAYEKVLRECAVLEQKVLELEHQKQLEQVTHDLRQPAAGPSSSLPMTPQSREAMGFLEGLQAENTRLQFDLGRASYASSNPLYEFQ